MIKIMARQFVMTYVILFHSVSFSLSSDDSTMIFFSLGSHTFPTLYDLDWAIFHGNLLETDNDSKLPSLGFCLPWLQ